MLWYAVLLLVFPLFSRTNPSTTGYLGINGAGKTTTLEMLTADLLPTEGTAKLDGLDILTHQKEIRRRIG
jgi:ABC-type multidrug transport system ATPase subunit